MANELAVVNAAYYANLTKVIEELKAKYDLTSVNPAVEPRFTVEGLQAAVGRGIEATDGKMKWIEYGPASFNLIWLQAALVRPWALVSRSIGAM